MTVATGAGHIKTGSGSRSERVLAKFNQFLRIEEKLKGSSTVAGRKAFALRGVDSNLSEHSVPSLSSQAIEGKNENQEGDNISYVRIQSTVMHSRQ
ncbi:MAG: hypothetical protein WAM39_05815 [Bryobacteraceae bacterium]